MKAPHHPGADGKGDKASPLDHPAYKLMAEDHPRAHSGDLSVVDVEVRATDGGKLHLDQGIRFLYKAGFLHILDHNLERLLVDHRLHRTSRATRTSSCAAWT